MKAVSGINSANSISQLLYEGILYSLLKCLAILIHLHCFCNHLPLFFHRLIDLTTRHRAETEMETERLRSSQIQAERTLEARERSHRQRVKGLEEQVATLKDQLGQEIRKRQAYIRFGLRNYLVCLFAPMAQLIVNEGQHGFNTSLFKVLANVILVHKFWKSQRVAINYSKVKNMVAQS